MLISSDVLNTARAILHRLFYRNVLGTAGSIFSIEVFERDIAPCRWLANIEVSECRVYRPITFSLSLAPPSPHPLHCGVAVSVFEMSSSFSYADKQYGYWRGRWHENGAPMSAELPERLHPLASVSAATVDATVVRIESLSALDKFLAVAGVHPSDTMGYSPL